jgi:KaiC/GvpD/RAD55 family RecA-like ATPase
VIRTVPTGDVGFDVILGGGWRLIERLPGRESATIVVRGGPGTGKTLLSLDVGLALAGALHGDVVVACVELLPTEYFAQIEAGRAELVSQYRDGPPLSESTVIVLPQPTAVSSSKSPRIFCGLLPELGDDVPDLVAALELLLADVTALDGKPAAFIVDSLIAGYGLGPSTPRKNVDAVMKFAAQGGFGLVLCEETTDDTPSVWDFTADTLLALEHHRGGGRQILVRKHRYGASATGQHQFEIRGWRQPRVCPRPDVWLGRHRNYSTLRTYGWKFLNGHGYPPLRWIDDLAPSPDPRDYPCSLAVIAGPNLELARRLAFGLMPVGTESQKDVVIDFDPVGVDTDGWSSKNISVHSLSVAAGVNVAICELVEYLGGQLFGDDNFERPRRIVMGDVGTVAAFADSELWAEGIGVIASLVAESGWGIPIIVYDSNALSGTGAGGLAALRWRADLVIEANHSEKGTGWFATSRPDGTSDMLRWPNESLIGQWPREIEHLARLPSSRRMHFSTTSKAKRRGPKPERE